MMAMATTIQTPHSGIWFFDSLAKRPRSGRPPLQYFVNRSPQRSWLPYSLSAEGKESPCIRLQSCLYDREGSEADKYPESVETSLADIP